MSSAVTQVGRLPKKTVKLIQWFCSLRRLDFGNARGRIPMPFKSYQTVTSVAIGAAVMSEAENQPQMNADKCR
jgi:hypothetical protein